MFEEIIARFPHFTLAAVRCFGLIMTTPLLSTPTVSRAAKIALAGFMAFLALPTATSQNWQIDNFNLDFLLLLVGEGLIGVITGLFITLIFAAFSSAGQFFTYQMGFGASEVYDALAQVENPLMGQFFNMVAILVFLQTDCMQTLFLGGFFRSIESINAFTLVSMKEHFMRFLLSGLTDLFFDAMVISLPIMGTLFLISLATGILSKAAPQMNLLSEGFPITIMCAFFLIIILLPVLINFFSASFDRAFIKLENLFATVIPGGI